MNTYWTIKHKNGWLSLKCFYTRKGLIEDYLFQYRNGMFRGRSWRWHKRKFGISAVKVRLVEV